MSYGNYPELKYVKKILVVKMRQLGDTLLTTPVFSVLKKHLPEAKIDAYVYKESFPLLESNPAISSLIGYDRNWKKRGFFFRLFQELKLFWTIWKNRYDLVINLTEGDRGVFASLAANAKIRVGFEPKGKWQKKIYTHTVKNCPTLRHNVERNLDALRRIGIFPSQEERGLFLHAKPNDQVTEPFVLIHPTSRWKFKCWPKEKMKSVAEHLIKEGYKVVFTSGPDPLEVAMVQEIVQGLDVINLSGSITLSQLVNLIYDCQFLLCVDSLPFHIASALKKKVIALFGPTSDVSWGPWKNPNARVIAQNFSCRPCYQDGCGGSKHSDCLASLAITDVIKEIESIQKEKKPLSILDSFAQIN